jgi:hypothetical protein
MDVPLLISQRRTTRQNAFSILKHATTDIAFGRFVIFQDIFKGFKRVSRGFAIGDDRRRT